MKRNKVELDAVLAEVGSSRLFGYFMDLIEKKHPKRDYTRVIESRPALEHHYPKAIRNFTRYILDHVESITKDEMEDIQSELKDVKGFLDVPEEIDKRYGKIIVADEQLKNIAESIKNFLYFQCKGHSRDNSV